MAEESGKLIDGMKHAKLVRELDKIEKIERSDIRMLETARHRFRAKLKRFKVPQLSSGSDAMDVRMYETHNPGFCYRCTGAIRTCDKSPRKKLVDVFDVVYSMLFTNGEVDPDKVLCLHILAAHYAKSGSSESSKIRPITSLVEKGKKENFSGPWNSLLPCYVLDIQRWNVNDVTNFSDPMKRHEDPLVVEAEEEIIKDFECKYEKYLKENSDVGLAISNNHKRTKMIPNGIGKITIIPPHVYSLLGAAQELKIKQVVAEESRRKKFRRSNSSIKNVDDQSISFRLDDEEDVLSRRLMTGASNRGWNGSRIISTSKVSAFRSLSRRSTTSSQKTEPSIAMLKRASRRSSDVASLLKDLRNDTEIVTIKSSNRTMGCTPSKTSSTKSPFRNLSNGNNPRSPCSYSIMSGVSGFFGEPRKISGPIFINSPVESVELRNKGYETVPILVNNQMQALVHSVLDVLERVNPRKMRRIVSTAKSPYEIRRMLIRPDIQLFIDSLNGQPLISSPDNFVISMATVLNEIDPRVESSIEKELVATTLAVPPAPGLHRLVEQIRSNLFVDPESAIGSKDQQVKIETFGSQKQKLLGFRTPWKDPDDRKDVFDVDNSCQHSDIQETKMTCACCYAKWKDSLPDIERSKVPDFSFLDNHEVEITPENATKCEIKTRTSSSTRIKSGDERTSQNSDNKKKRPDGPLSPLQNNQKPKNAVEAVTVQSVETNAFRFPVQDPEMKSDLSSPKKTKYFHSSKSKPLKRGALPKVWKASEGSVSTKGTVHRKSRLDQNTSWNKLFEKSTMTRAKRIIDQINEARSYEDTTTSIAGLKTDCEGTMISTSLQKRSSKITFENDSPSSKCQFKPWKASLNTGYLEPDRIILRRMTNPQRILVGQMCASLKTRKINTEGLVKERTPLAALITPVLSHGALKILTKGTRQAMSRRREKIEEKDDSVTIVSEKLTGPVLAKIRQAIAENETNRRLNSFLKSKI